MVEFVRTDDNTIKMSGITRNPNVFCTIGIKELTAGQRDFPCSIKGLSYQLSTSEAQTAMLIATNVISFKKPEQKTSWTHRIIGKN